MAVTIIVPERHSYRRLAASALEPVAEAQTFESPYPVRTMGRFLVLVDRSWPQTRYGFCLEADPLGHPVPDVLCWATPYTPLEREERRAEANAYARAIPLGAWTYDNDVACARMRMGRVECTVSDTLAEHHAAAVRWGDPVPAYLLPLLPVEREMLRLLDWPQFPEVPRG